MKILAGIDFSEVSDQVVNKAAEYALAFDAKLWLVHVAAPNPDFVGYEVGPKVVRDHRANELKKEHAKLKEYADACEEMGVRCIPLLIQGTTLDTILEVLNKLNVDLVVIGSHTNSSLYDFVVGSIKNELFHKAKLPVLLVPRNSKDS
ncbi:MAG: universal stress protein [Crocinitomicaceae bacterium]|mgnify:CR=1 FL=1|nr:universal stress protein [Crocinitomicaceae bacterium]